MDPGEARDQLHLPSENMPLIVINGSIGISIDGLEKNIILFIVSLRRDSGRPPFTLHLGPGERARQNGINLFNVIRAVIDTDNIIL